MNMDGMSIEVYKGGCMIDKWMDMGIYEWMDGCKRINMDG